MTAAIRREGLYIGTPSFGPITDDYSTITETNAIIVDTETRGMGPTWRKRYVVDNAVLTADNEEIIKNVIVQTNNRIRYEVTGEGQWVTAGNIPITIVNSSATATSTTYELGIDPYGTATGAYTLPPNFWNWRDVNPKSWLKNQIKQNLLIKVDKSFDRQPLDDPKQANELKARRTLRDMLSEAEWRRYVTNGFVMVKGHSGDWYQVFHNARTRVKVYRKGKLHQTVCIHTDDSVPPTDHVINLKVLIELDENGFLASGNIRPEASRPRSQRVTARVPLVDAYEMVYAS